MADEWRSIGVLAGETGIKASTIRFYEQVGLMPPPLRTEGAWRVYGQAAAARLRFIKHAREFGFSLAQIRVLAGLADAPDRPCEQATQLARSQLAEVEVKLKRLRALRLELRRMAKACGGAGASDCHVIAALTGELGPAGASAPP